MTDYRLCGWRVSSDLVLPELSPWGKESVPADVPADVAIRLEPLPERLDDAIDRTPFVSISPDGTALIEIRAVGRYLIRDGREILVEPAVSVDSPALRAFLWGTSLGLLCHQRGLFPLHAASAAIRGRAVALTGASGRGKSTLAAALCGRGHTILSDDVCVIDPAMPGGPAVLPTFPFVHLWGDAIDALGIATGGLAPVRLGIEKFQVRLPQSTTFDFSPVPLGAVLRLVDGRLDAVARIERRRGFEATCLVADEVYRRRFASRLGHESVLFEGSSRIASHAWVGCLSMRREFAALGSAVTLIEEMIEA